VTTEDDFLRQIECQPFNFNLRLVFADWLQERDDPRANGYRAIGYTELVTTTGQWFSALDYRQRPPHDCSNLPQDWLELMADFTHITIYGNRRRSVIYEDSIKAMAAAVRAFILLPAARRAEFLDPERKVRW
jgi:uncharacterized protein (TIGR02996 family)